MYEKVQLFFDFVLYTGAAVSFSGKDEKMNENNLRAPRKHMKYSLITDTLIFCGNDNEPPDPLTENRHTVEIILGRPWDRLACVVQARNTHNGNSAEGGVQIGANRLIFFIPSELLGKGHLAFKVRGTDLTTVHYSNEVSFSVRSLTRTDKTEDSAVNETKGEENEEAS